MSVRRFSELTPEKEAIEQKAKFLRATIEEGGHVNVMADLHVNEPGENGEKTPVWFSNFIISFNNFENKFDSKFANFESEIHDIKLKQVTFNTDLTNTATIADANKTKITCITNDVENILKENTMLKNTVDQLQRRENLILDGLEVKNEISLIAHVKVFIDSHFSTLIDDIRITQCYRIGKPGTKPRPILIKFATKYERDLIWKKRTFLKGSNLYLSEDFSPSVKQARKSLYPYFKAAHRVYGDSPTTHVYLSHDKLLIGKSTYTVDTINDLPTEIKESHTRIENGITLFFRAGSPLSNFHPAEFRSEGKDFLTAEHYWQYQMALLSNQKGLAEKILQTETPIAAKGLGHQIKKDYRTNIVESEHAIAIMTDAVRLKFEQNATLLDYLCNTRGRLAEASTDTFWGTGININDRQAVLRDKWTGQNHLGEILERLRKTHVE